MLIARELLDDVVAHAREEYDAECCGLIGYAPGADGADRADDAQGADGAEDRAVRVHRARNVFASRKRFEIDGRELLRTIDEFEDDGLELGAIYHSHTHTEPYPSETDINFAANWPGLEWVIVGLAGSEPNVRCYLIDGGAVREVALEVR
jgi:proteasome lid subunit RPN8/RPN11